MSAPDLVSVQPAEVSEPPEAPGSSRRAQWRLAAWFVLALLGIGCMLVPVIFPDPLVRFRPYPPQHYFERGTRYQAKGLLEMAAADLQFAIRHDPWKAGYHVALASIELDRTRLQSALEQLQVALWIDPGVAHAHSVRAQVLGKLGRSAEALQEFDEAIRLDPHNAGLYVARAEIHAKVGAIEPAIADYERAVTLDSTQAGWVVRRNELMKKRSP